MSRSRIQPRSSWKTCRSILAQSLGLPPKVLPALLSATRALQRFLREATLLASALALDEISSSALAVYGMFLPLTCGLSLCLALIRTNGPAAAGSQPRKRNESSISRFEPSKEDLKVENDHIYWSDESSEVSDRLYTPHAFSVKVVIKIAIPRIFCNAPARIDDGDYRDEEAVWAIKNEQSLFAGRLAEYQGVFVPRHFGAFETSFHLPLPRGEGLASAFLSSSCSQTKMTDLGDAVIPIYLSAMQRFGHGLPGHPRDWLIGQRYVWCTSPTQETGSGKLNDSAIT